jgi:single-strand DNA-binding protein
MNIIAIKGRLVRDPECRKTPNDITTCKITVAVDRAYSSGGEKQTDFFDCVFWRQGAEFVSKYFSKGKEIIVQGEMQSRKWTDKEGNNRISWEIQNAHAEFCGGKGETSPATYEAPASPASDFAMLNDTDLQLPF